MSSCPDIILLMFGDVGLVFCQDTKAKPRDHPKSFQLRIAMIDRSPIMDIEIITVGFEILEGDVLDTNSNWMADKISGTGNRLKRITVIGDRVPVIARCLRESLARSPGMILISGGLGPTKDDLTLEGVAMGLGIKLVDNEQAMTRIRERYAGMHPEIPLDNVMTGPRRKMGRLPEGSTPVDNPAGTAPGVKILKGETTIICLPGVPSELKAIFIETVLPLLSGRHHALSRSIFIVGIGESSLAPHLNQVMRETGVEIRSYPSKGKIRIKIIGKESEKATNQLIALLPVEATVTGAEPSVECD